MAVLRACVPLAAAALALVAVAQSASDGTGPHCTALFDKYHDNVTQPRYVSRSGVLCGVAVLHARDAAARAAAALLAAVLRAGAGLRYRGVRLRAGAGSACELAHEYNLPMPSNTTEFVVAASATLVPLHACEALRRCNDSYMVEPPRVCRAAGARLHALAPGAAPRARRLLLRAPADCRLPDLPGLPDAGCGLPRDADLNDYDHDNETTADWLNLIPTDGRENRTLVFLPSEWRVEAEWAGRAGADAAGRPLRPVALESDAGPRRRLRRLLRENRRLLLLDHALWAGADGLREAPLPPPTPDLPTLSVADAKILHQYAPRLYDAVRRFAPEPADLREVLVGEADVGDAEEAACRWAAVHSARFEAWSPRRDDDAYEIVAMLCEEDPARGQYEAAARAAGAAAQPARYRLRLRLEAVPCASPNIMQDVFEQSTNKLRWMRVLGFAVPCPPAGPAVLPEAAAVRETALLTYEVSPRVESGAAGPLPSLVDAHRHFLRRANWARVAVLSDDAAVSQAFLAQLVKDSTLVTTAPSLPGDAADDAIRGALEDLRDRDARVFLVNAGGALAARLLCAARGAGLADESRAWLLRESAAGTPCAAGEQPPLHYTVSFYWRGGQDSADSAALLRGGGRAALRAELDAQLGVPWPPLVAPLVDTLLTLAAGFDELLHRRPENRDDAHASGNFGEFETIIGNLSIPGVADMLRYEGGSRVAPLVFVDEWRGGARLAAGAWRQRGNAAEDERWAREPYGGSPPGDGTRSCGTTWAGDPFAPSCHDAAWAAAVASLAIAAVALGWAGRARRARRLAREREQRARLVERRHRVTAALAGRCVPRDALELREELGAGRYGRVRLALLRAPGRGPPLAVAAKALADDAAPSEEREFLREAALLARLEHPHVVRLAGVCYEDEVLLLMEHAFFGDLARYLRERRHLAGWARAGLAAPGEEAAHVAAPALTRLAREAAAALEYLAARRVLHRDVRAANCLVDARRTLKLADFGMARELAAAAQAASPDEYTCRRRALFPVLWMAPESLSRGVFSHASDAWALGVLVLELATLGARPYGEAPPCRVVSYVRDGGRPPLPPDVTPEMRGLVLWCWQRSPEKRPSAAEVGAYLAAHPHTVSPALMPYPARASLRDLNDCLEESLAAPLLPAHTPSPAPSAECDSGFGETLTMTTNTGYDK